MQSHDYRPPSLAPPPLPQSVLSRLCLAQLRAPPPPPPIALLSPRDINTMFGITASDIDKYSRILFPITFCCFQLMYWVIYDHLSDIVVEDLVLLQKD